VIARLHLASFFAVVLSGIVVGCGSSGGGSSTTIRHAQRTPTPALPPLPKDGAGDPVVPTPRPTGIPPNTAAVAVIRAWSDALRQGDVRGAAGYFAIPSLMINGTDQAGAVVITIGTREQAVAANLSLPCGATLLAADQRGRYINALFRLTGRPGVGGSGCGSGVGSTARTNFVIAHGRIVEWIRAPDDPGDNGIPAVPAPPPPAPQTASPTV
jgi:hypothetical protein